MPKDIEVRTPAGGTFYVNEKKAAHLEETQQADRIGPRLLLMRERIQTSFRQYSNRTQWRPWPSGGATVMQLR